MILVSTPVPLGLIGFVGKGWTGMGMGLGGFGTGLDNWQI